MAINLGDKVSDLVMTFTGIVIAVANHLHGCDRMVVQPQELIDGKPVKNEMFDDKRLQVLETGVVPVFPPNVDVSGIPLGSIARDTVTGYSGMVSIIETTITGDILVILEPTKRTKDGGIPEAQAFQAGRLEPVAKKAVPVSTDAAPGKSGGPQRNSHLLKR